MSDLSDLAVACNKILTLEKAIGENRFIRALPFSQIKPTDKSKFEANKLRFIGEIEILKCQRKTKQI